MKLLDKLLLKEVLPLFFYGVLAFSVLILGINVLYQITRIVIDFDLPFSQTITLLALKLPEVIVYTFPMATLFAVLLGFSRLSNDLEIIAFGSAGVSFYRLVFPIMVFAFIITLATLSLNDVVVPKSNTIFKEKIFKITNKNNGVKFKENIFIKDEENGEIKQVLFAASMTKGALNSVSFYQFHNNKISSITNAEEGIWTKSSWKFFKGRRYNLDKKGNPTNIVNFYRMDIIFSHSPEDIAKQQREIQELTIREAREKILLIKKEIKDALKNKDTKEHRRKQHITMNPAIRKLQVDYYNKIAIPFASCVFALIGAPLGVRPQRATSSIGLGLSIVIVFIYYIVLTFSRVCAQGGLSPLLAACLPNAAGFSIGIVLNMKVPK